MCNEIQTNQTGQKDNSLFGIYLNQARLNAYIALCYISELLGEKTVDEDSLSEMPVLRFLDSDKDIVKSKRTFELLEKRFPMLKVIYDGEPKKEQDDKFLERTKKYKEILTCLIKALNDKRNEFCHANTKGGGGEYDIKQLIRYLNNCFDASVRRVKDVRGLEEEDVFHLRRKTSQGKGREKRVIDNPNFYYHFQDKEGKISEKGLAFLASVFLEKKDAHELLKKQRGFKKDDTPGYKATLESFYCFRIKLPKPVMKSDEDKNGLALDMLNELKKCPKEIFDLLPKEQQEEFRVIDTSDDNEDDNEILMRRYSDRFPYLALRYCDENELFENLRFQIDLGRYYFKFYEKQTIDGNTQQRSLDKKLKTFGRIKEVKDKVQQQWQDVIKSPDEIEDEQKEPYKANTTPHYNLVDNQIGFVMSRDCNLPDLNQPDGKLKLQKPDAWLSIYELPGMIFHGLTSDFKQTEILINKYIGRQRSICKKIFGTGSIPQDAGEYLPEALKDIEENDTKRTSYAKKKLCRILEDTEQRIKAIKKTEQRLVDKSNKPGKKQFFDIRAGKLADFLARDIMILQSFDPAKDGKDKLTSINYQVLQATLAYYGAKKDSIADMFKTIGLLDGDNPHPFLKEINPSKYNSIVEFYKAYLNRKKGYLEKCEKEGKFDEQFLRPSRQRYAKGKRDLKTIAKQLLDNPVNIPKGFFQKQIKEFVCVREPSLEELQMNTAYMIQAYFEKEYGTQQPFCSYQKTYPVVSKSTEYCKKAKNKEIKEVLRKITAEMSYRELRKFIDSKIPDGRYEPENLKKNLLDGCRDFKNNERLLRRFKVQDMVMFMMVEKTLKDQLAFEGNVIKLKDITPVEDSPFNKPVFCSSDVSASFNTNKKYESGYVDFIKKNYKGLYISQGGRIILKYRVTSESTKLKDIGKYRRYLYDRRLPGLLIWKYPPNIEGGIEIKYADIEEEIKAYEKYRKQIVQQIYMLEKKAVDHFKLEIEPEENHIPFNTVTDTIKFRLAGSEEKCDTLLNIRNSINHNQFPVFDEKIENAQGQSISERMFSITENYVKYITEHITESDKDFAYV